MQLSKNTHLFVDPTVGKHNGISSYCEQAFSLLEKDGRSTFVLKRNNNEKLECFRLRLFDLLKKEDSNVAQIEAPESGASTLLLHYSLPIHIRLHCAQSLGAFWSGEKIDPIMQSYEQEVINRARWISAPSFAAWRETRRLFNVNSAYIFPNPAPEMKNNSCLNRRGILMVGRAQALKGVFFLNSLLKKIPNEIPVTLVGSGMVSVARNLGISDRVVTYNCMEKDKVLEMMRSSVGVLVASPFETFSMVASEALSVNTPVITWSHSGAAELGSYPLIRAIQPWNMDAMAKAIIDLNDETLSLIVENRKNFNSEYLLGSTSLSLNKPPQLWVDEGEQNNSFVEQPAEISIMKNLFDNSKFNRKFRKLKRDPFGFVKDMRLIKVLKNIKFTNNKKNLHDDFRISTIDIFDKKFEGLKYPVLIQNQNSDKSIIIKKINSVDSRSRSVLAINDSNCKFEINLLRELKKFSKESALLDEKHLSIGYFYNFGESELPVEEVMKNIKLGQRAELTHTQNIIACRSSYSVARALRGCHSGTRLFIVVLPNDPQLEIPSNEIDTLIVPLGYEVKKNLVKRVLFYPNISDSFIGVAGAILRACQEASPKPLEILLPIFGKCEYDPTLLDVDTKITEGILFLDCCEDDICNEKKLNFNENFILQISIISKFISGIMICENALWRYKSLIDSADSLEDWSNFLKIAVADGLRFQVRIKNKNNI